MVFIKYLKGFLYILMGLLVTCLLLTTLNYFNVVSPSILKILKVIGIFISIFIGGFYIGKNSNSKGYIEGIKIGFIIILLSLILNVIIFKENFKIDIFIYYVIILVSSVFSSIIGINKKAKN